MRVSLLLSTVLPILFSSLSFNLACAQTDPGMDAAMAASQQAAIDSQMASQQAMQDAQSASQLANQQAMDAATTSNCCGYGLTFKPNFSLKPGAYPTTITVRMKDRTRGAIIYYTTDGWTPTLASARYMGPITLTSTTTLQAVAYAPMFLRSAVASATYKLPGPAPSPTRNASLPILPEGGSFVLQRDTPVSLLFNTTVNSRTAEVGDKLSLTLAEDLLLNGQVLAPKGSMAEGRVIQVDPAGAAGAPGEITFQVETLRCGGQIIPLRGVETMEGQDHVTKVRSFLMVPGVGIAGLLIHGQNAEIKSGTPLVATIPAGSVIAPAT